MSFSDRLDKLVRGGAPLGGLSDLAFDRQSGSWASTIDNHGTDPARLWFWSDSRNPSVDRDPLVLRRPDGTAYDGRTTDNEGLAVLPGGDFLVSSEAEPSIRVFGRDGVQQASLDVPARFAVTGSTPQGQATVDATLEGLTIAPAGTRIVAAMESPLSSDADPTLNRFLVYDRDQHGSWQLTKQITYRTERGNRVPEIQAYGADSLLVLEGSYSPGAGNSVSLYAVTGISHAADVSGVANLSQGPASAVVTKSLVADLARCPALAAPTRQAQRNPLLDNFEGMAVTEGPGDATVTLISDDNFAANQITRVLSLTVHLP
ncbi:esterase-like activity of phytase family protein [Dactylosporangium sp. NBC_01737]|uniref:esterase-like activity of phytase family protein n=1 Tax=Dactylosporangium sp. NBC_01737 TaxID=2975959 RepID=UPI002E116CBD|nr:esterase-like activity of phytase family protein [Dactylosporangium sp. NBC_01737]